MQHSEEHRLAVEERQSSSEIQWHSTSSEWLSCGSVPLSWSGGQGPFTLNGLWWPDSNTSNGQDTDMTTATGRQWTIAENVNLAIFNWVGESRILRKLAIELISDKHAQLLYPQTQQCALIASIARAHPPLPLLYIYTSMERQRRQEEQTIRPGV